MEVRLDPWMFGTKQFAHRTDRNDFAVGERCNAIANSIQAGKVMGDHEDRQPERLLQRSDQIIEVAGRDRVQPGCRLVKKNNCGVKRERTRQARRALSFRPRVRTETCRRPRLSSPTISSLAVAISFMSDFGKDKVLPKRKLNILQCRQRRKQCALLKQDAPHRSGVASRSEAIVDINAHDLDMAASFWNKSDDRPHQHGFAAAGRADQAENFAPANIQRQMVDHGLLAEIPPRDRSREWQIALADPSIVTFQSMQRNTANAPSSTMTRKIDLTTEIVVCLAEGFRASLDPQTLAACDDADDQRHERRLDHSDLEMRHGDGFVKPRDVISPGSSRHRTTPQGLRHRGRPSSL